jgi:hypothetical protein
MVIMLTKPFFEDFFGSISTGFISTGLISKTKFLLERKVTVGIVKDPILFRIKERKEGDINQLKKLIS